MSNGVTSGLGTYPNGTAAATATAAASKTQDLGIAGSFNTFLALLTTQLKNQDPTNAMDTNAMTQQLVSFASVEQQMNMNSNLQSLIGLQQASAVSSAAPLLGRQVEVVSNQLSLQNGRAALRLPPAGSATQALITVTDAGGRTIKSEVVPLGASGADWQWNGISDSTGRRMPDGAYAVAVAGRDAAGNPQPIAATTVATATSTTYKPASSGSGAGSFELNLGGLAVPFTAIRNVRN
jgi:flagellar basal-body rod modification protein FlgD